MSPSKSSTVVLCYATIFLFLDSDIRTHSHVYKQTHIESKLIQGVFPLLTQKIPERMRNGGKDLFGLGLGLRRRCGHGRNFADDGKPLPGGQKTPDNTNCEDTSSLDSLLAHHSTHSRPPAPFFFFFFSFFVLFEKDELSSPCKQICSPVEQIDGRTDGRTDRATLLL